MLHAHDDFALEDFVAAGEAVFLGVLVPLVEDVEFLVRGWIDVLHAGDDFDGAGATRAVKATGFHLDSRRLTGIKKQRSGRNFGRLATGQKRNFRHKI